MTKESFKNSITLIILKNQYYVNL